MISDERFQQAVATASDDRMFAHVPVDWWDAPAQVWRPSVLESRSEGETTHASIMAPGLDEQSVTEVNYVAKRVAISELRPSRLVDEAIAQFFTTRYTLELVDTLMPCLDMASTEERNQLDIVLNDLLEVYTTSYETWLQAYARGSREGLAVDAAWDDHAVDAALLPRRRRLLAGSSDIFTAIEAEARRGAIDCSPVALWDEEARIWRPTMMLGATGDAEQFSPGARVDVLVPGEPVDVIAVSGAMLQPLEIADTCFSLIAIPVLARDYLRMHDALKAAGFDATDAAAHPFVISFARMLAGAADEWSGLFEDGLPGAAPEPRVTPLHPTQWGLTFGDNERVRDERVRG